MNTKKATIRGRICAVKFCPNSKLYLSQDIKFFRFPKDIRRCKEWIKACGRENLFKMYGHLNDTPYRVCILHFPKEMIINTRHSRLALNRAAVPVLNLPAHQPSCSGESSFTHKKMKSEVALIQHEVHIKEEGDLLQMHNDLKEEMENEGESSFKHKKMESEVALIQDEVHIKEEGDLLQMHNDLKEEQETDDMDYQGSSLNIIIKKEGDTSESSGDSTETGKNIEIDPLSSAVGVNDEQCNASAVKTEPAVVLQRENLAAEFEEAPVDMSQTIEPQGGILIDSWIEMKKLFKFSTHHLDDDLLTLEPLDFRSIEETRQMEKNKIPDLYLNWNEESE